jgi:hypothetical protein
MTQVATGVHRDDSLQWMAFAILEAHAATRTTSAQHNPTHHAQVHGHHHKACKAALKQAMSFVPTKHHPRRSCTAPELPSQPSYMPKDEFVTQVSPCAAQLATHQVRGNLHG